MKKLDYNKIMGAIGVLLIIIFCIMIIIDYNSYDMFNSAPFFAIILVRVIEFWLPGALLIYLYNQNTDLKVTEYSIQSDKLPKTFNGYKIAHISDFHNTNSKRIKVNIVESLKNNKPDIIVITGDLIDSRRTNILNAKEFLENIVTIAPVYYVLGNHESRLYNIQNLINEVKDTGVNVLRNISVKIQKQGDIIELWGFDDPSFFAPLENNCQIKQSMDNVLKTVVKDRGSFKILLIHRPELLDTYAKFGFDLVFTGHAHGGQIRLPLAGGLIAPGQGLFPEFTRGIYINATTQMILSRGIGNSKFPFRINNKPEIIIATLKGIKY